MLIVYQPDLSMDKSFTEVFQNAEVLAIQKKVVVQFKYWGEMYYVDNSQSGTQKHGEGFKGLNIFPKPTARIMN